MIFFVKSALRSLSSLKLLILPLLLLELLLDIDMFLIIYKHESNKSLIYVQALNLCDNRFDPFTFDFWFALMSLWRSTLFLFIFNALALMMLAPSISPSAVAPPSVCTFCPTKTLKLLVLLFFFAFFSFLVSVDLFLNLIHHHISWWYQSLKYTVMNDDNETHTF